MTRAPRLEPLGAPRASLAARLAPAAALGLVPLGEYHNTVEAGLVIAFLVLSLSLHEVAHAWTALRCGDTTARDMGRLSLNPIVHIDLVWTIVIPAVMYFTSGFIFGGAKPVPVAYHRLRSPLRDMSLVAIAGPLTNLLLGAFFVVAWKAAVYSGRYGDDALLARVLALSAFYNVLLFTFNLLPIPPLDGSRIMVWLLPPSLREPYASLERFGLILVVLLLYFVPGFQRFLLLGILEMLQYVDQLSGGNWTDANTNFIQKIPLFRR